MSKKDTVAFVVTALTELKAGHMKEDGGYDPRMWRKLESMGLVRECNGLDDIAKMVDSINWEITPKGSKWLKENGG